MFWAAQHVGTSSRGRLEPAGQLDRVDTHPLAVSECWALLAGRRMLYLTRVVEAPSREDLSRGFARDTLGRRGHAWHVREGSKSYMGY